MSKSRVTVPARALMVSSRRPKPCAMERREHASFHLDLTLQQVVSPERRNSAKSSVMLGLNKSIPLGLSPPLEPQNVTINSPHTHFSITLLVES